MESKKCYVCGKSPLSKDEIGITKKLIDKKTVNFYCLTCLAEYFEVDYFFGTQAQNCDGKWKIVGQNCKGQEKIRRISEKLSENEINKAESVGFSDSMSDYPFSRLVKSFYLVDKKRWKTVKSFIQ